MSVTYTSPCAIYLALGESFERYPERWYENTRLLLLATAVLTAILIFLQSQLSIPVSPGAWASVLAVSGWIVVWFADVYSTGRIGDMRLEFDRRELVFHWEERNPLLPLYPTWRNLIFNWTNVFSLFLCVCFFFVPLLVIVPVFFRGAIFLGNWRGLLRLKLALERFDNEAEDRGVAGR